MSKTVWATTKPAKSLFQKPAKNTPKTGPPIKQIKQLPDTVIGVGPLMIGVRPLSLYLGRLIFILASTNVSAILVLIWTYLKSRVSQSLPEKTRALFYLTKE